MNWSNPSLDLLSKIGDLHEEHRDIVDECIESYCLDSLQSLSATQEQLLGPMRSSEIITGVELLELANQCSTGQSLIRSEIEDIEINMESCGEQPGFSIIRYSVQKLKTCSMPSTLSPMRNSVMLSMLGCATYVVQVHSLNLNCRILVRFQ